MGRPNRPKGRKDRGLRESAPTLREIFVRFWPLIRKQRKPITVATIGMFAEIGLRLLEPWPLKYVFDTVIAPTSATVSTPFGGIKPMTLIACAAVAVVAIAALGAAAAYQRRVGYAIAGNRILTACRADLFTHMQRLSLSFHSARRSGDLIMRVTGDIGRVKEVVITAALPFTAHLITLTAMLAIMTWMNWQLALIALAIIPLFFLVTRRLGGRIRKIARRQRERKGEMGATATEAIGSIKTVQALSLEDVHAETFATRNKSDGKEDVKAKRLSARLVGTTDILIALGSAGVLLLGARLVMAGDLTPGDLIVFLAYVKSSLRPVRSLAKYSGRISKAAASAERIIEILDTTPEIQDRPNAIEAPDRIDAVTFEGVTFGYEPDRTAVDSVSLEARRGEVIVLAGPSGAGKSTIVNLLLRLYDPTEGSISIDGRDIRDFTIATLRRAVAVVPQENVLFAVSARDNIAYGAPGASDEEVVAAARLAQAHDFITAMPQGYDTPLGERGGTISEGQRQRIAIARAAIRNAPILVLDEPTASLDRENTMLIRRAVRNLSADRVTFIIAHDLSTVADDHRVVFLDHGRIVETGTHEELLRREGRYAAMYAIQPHDESGRAMLSEADARVIDRDPALPGLRLVLDPDAATETWRQCYPDAGITRVEPRYVRYKQGTSCLVAYRVHSRADAVDAYAKAHSLDAGAKTTAADADASVQSRLGGGVVMLPEHAIVLYPFPNDRRLPALQGLAAPDDRAAMLRTLLPGRPQLWDGTLVPLRYKPERRFVAHVLGADGDGAAIKFYTRDDFRVIGDNATRLVGEPPLRIPEHYGHSKPLRAAAIEWMQGRSLSEAVAERVVTTRDFETAGAALAALHTQKARVQVFHTADAFAETLRDAATAIGEIAPVLAARAERLAEHLAEKLTTRHWRARRTIHGDLTTENILLQYDAVAIVDLDRASRGDPRLDLGTLQADLLRAVIRGALSADEAATWLDAMLDGYRAASDKDVTRKLGRFTAASLLRSAVEPFRFRRPEWLAEMEAILDRAEGLLRTNPRTPSTAGDA